MFTGSRIMLEYRDNHISQGHGGRMEFHSYVRKNPDKGLRVLFGQNLVLHCHHYNSRIQKTIENNRMIDGRCVFRTAADQVFSDMMIEMKLELGRVPSLQDFLDLYQFLGFGVLDAQDLEQGMIRSSSSHYCEGWKMICTSSSSSSINKNVCTFTEGFLQAALRQHYGRSVCVRESQCAANQCACCEFRIEFSSVDEKFEPVLSRHQRPCEVKSFVDDVFSANIDRQKIITAVFGLPLEGNAKGLIPNFNVYLAHMPQDVYDLMCIRYVEEMEKIGLREIAVSLLREDAEHCAMNTFFGIMNSVEWDGLVLPMVKETEDNLYGLISVANALGWGVIRVKEHEPYQKLVLKSLNAYEATGYLKYRKISQHNECHMLTGITAGLMELIYGEGELCDRVGMYMSDEVQCSASGVEYCIFEARRC